MLTKFGAEGTGAGHGASPYAEKSEKSGEGIEQSRQFRRGRGDSSTNYSAERLIATDE